MRLHRQHERKRRLATILTNSIFLCIGILIIVVILQNYQVNRDVVAQEVARTKQQTRSLVQEIFNLKIKSLEITQDSYSRNRILVEGTKSHSIQTLDRFFNSMDEISPDVAPDFRYIKKQDSLIWDDANLQFYGVSQKHINKLSKEMATGSGWYLSQAPSSLGMRYLGMRRTAIVDMVTGEIVGHLYIGIVLNNNFSLVNAFTDSGNADETLLAVGSEVIAASSKNKSLKHIQWLEQSSQSLNAGRYMVSKTDLMINNVPTFVSVYMVQSNEHVMTFVRSHYIWISITTLFVIGIAISTRVWLGKRVSNELHRLMQYTDATIQEQKVRSGPQWLDT